MNNIAFWHRNIERKGFKIKGFVNHYPDFIIYTKSGKTILLETKGDHLDAEQKIRLGNLWRAKQVTTTDLLWCTSGEQLMALTSRKIF